MCSGQLFFSDKDVGQMDAIENELSIPPGFCILNTKLIVKCEKFCIENAVVIISKNRKRK